MHRHLCILADLAFLNALLVLEIRLQLDLKTAWSSSVADEACPEPAWYKVIDLHVLCLTDPVAHSAHQSGESGLKIYCIFKSRSCTPLKM